MPAPSLLTSPRAPLLVLAVGVAATSTGSIFARLADAPALTLSFWRCAIATALLLPFARRALVRDLARARPRELAAVLLAGVLLAVHFATWIASLESTSVASSVLLVNTSPLWTALLTRPLLGEHVPRRAWAGVGLALMGSVAITLGDLRLGGEALVGDGLALAGGLAASLYLLLGRRVRGSLSIAAYLPLCYGAAAVTLGLALLLTGTPAGGHAPATWGWILALALVPQLVGHSASNWAVRRVGATLVTLSLCGEPVLAPLLAWGLLDEAPPRGAWVGGPLILAAAWVAARGRPGARPDAAPKQIASS